MTRSHKANDPPRNNPDALPLIQDNLPKSFGKHSGHSEVPNKAKKNGSGKANWGRDGDEIQDSPEFTMHNPRRRSNSKGHIEDQFVKSKFETVEDDELFQEELHGAEAAETETAETASSASTAPTDKL